MLNLCPSYIQISIILVKMNLPQDLDLPDPQHLFLLAYTMDIMIIILMIVYTIPHVKYVEAMIMTLTQRYEMSMMGVLTYFLGFQIKQSERGISINQEKYVNDLLKKYDINGSSVKTPMVSPNKLGPDLKGKAINETRYQLNPKESYLIVVKRIFRYLKGTLSLGLWYPKCSGKLVCWSAKKQQSVAMSSTEAEYVAAAGCCANILWMKSQLTCGNCYSGEIGVKETLKKSYLPPRWRMLMNQTIQCLGGKTGGLDQISTRAHHKPYLVFSCSQLGTEAKPKLQGDLSITGHMRPICNLDVPVDSKTPKPSSHTKEVPQGKKPGAKSGLRRKQSSKHTSESKTKASKSKTGQSEKETQSSSTGQIRPSHLHSTLVLKDILSKLNELTGEVQGLKNQVHYLEIELPGELKEIPTKLDNFTKTVTSLTSQVNKLKTLQWELPKEFLSLPTQVLVSPSSKARDKSVPSVGQADVMPTKGEKNTNQATISQLFQRRAKKKDKGKKAMSLEDAEEESIKSDSDDETTYVPGSTVESSKKKELKNFHFVTEEAETYVSLLEGLQGWKKIALCQKGIKQSP
ncbi:uncharacterized mitochondrial protein-like protein [Tanacetum coccineum]